MTVNWSKKPPFLSAALADEQYTYIPSLLNHVISSLLNHGEKDIAKLSVWIQRMENHILDCKDDTKLWQ